MGILSLEVQDSCQQCFGDENMPHPISAQAFPVSFCPGFHMLHVQVTQGGIPSSGNGPRVDFGVPQGSAEHRAGQEGEQRDAGAGLMGGLAGRGSLSGWGSPITGAAVLSLAGMREDLLSLSSLFTCSLLFSEGRGIASSSW